MQRLSVSRQITSQQQQQQQKSSKSQREHNLRQPLFAARCISGSRALCAFKMENLCPYIEKGLKNGPPILFVSGFPDNEVSGWGEEFPAELEKNYRCIFMCLPGYSKTLIPAQDRAWGYDQDEVLTMMEATISSTGLSKEKFIMIAHDWGAFFALLYTTRHPNAVSKLVLCDIGMLDPANLPVATLPYLFFYQIYFAVTYVISQVISYKLANVIFWLLKYCFQFMMPTPNDRFHLPEKEITVRKCYPYYWLWRRLLTRSMLPAKFPTCPLLFVFGTDKRVMFHDQRFLDRIDATPGCQRFSLPAGHWFMIDQAQATIKLVRDFLKQ